MRSARALQPERMEDGGWRMDFAQRMRLVRAMPALRFERDVARNPFSKALARPMAAPPVSRMRVLIFPENLAAPEHWAGGSKPRLNREVQAFAAAAREDPPSQKASAKPAARPTYWIRQIHHRERPATFRERPGRRVCGSQIRDEISPRAWRDECLHPPPPDSFRGTGSRPGNGTSSASCGNPR